MVEPVRHRQTKGAETDMFEPKATASHLDSTLSRSGQSNWRCWFVRVKRTDHRHRGNDANDPTETCCSGTRSRSVSGRAGVAKMFLPASERSHSLSRGRGS